MSKIPPPEDLQYKEREILLSIYEQFAAASKIWFVLLGITVLSAIPGYYLLERVLSPIFISSYVPPLISDPPYPSKRLEISAVQAAQVTPDSYSLTARIFNPNPDLSAKYLEFEFIIRDGKTGQRLDGASGQTYIYPQKSKFLLIPQFRIKHKNFQLEAVVKNIQWTKRVPTISVALPVTGERTGHTPEGLFFVEGLVKNQNGFTLKKVEVPIIIFHPDNRRVVAANYTILSDLKPFETRYLRVLWPVSQTSLLKEGHGQIQISPEINLLADGIVVKSPDDEKIPAR